MATTNVRQLTTELSKFTKDMPEEIVVSNLRFIAREVATRVIPRTPIDTGRARHNWRLTFGAPAVGELRIPDPVSAALNSIKLIRNPYQGVFFSNNVPYIGFLEDGWSKQAPSGMLKITLQEVLSVLGV